jgi:hypothetical protein
LTILSQTGSDIEDREFNPLIFERVGKEGGRDKAAEIFLALYLTTPSRKERR